MQPPATEDPNNDDDDPPFPLIQWSFMELRILCEESSGVYGVIYDVVFMELFICTLEWTQ